MNREDYQRIKTALRTGVQVVSADQLFETPRELADRIAELAGIDATHDVLEPSAGTGRLLEAVSRHYDDNIFEPQEVGRLVLVEHNRALFERLREDYPEAMVEWGDFLEFPPLSLGEFDRVIMNPPFKNGDDIRHISHALRFLRPDGVLVAICANGPRQNDKLKPWSDTWEELPCDTFKGTKVRSVLLTISAERPTPSTPTTPSANHLKEKE